MEFRVIFCTTLYTFSALVMCHSAQANPGQYQQRTGAHNEQSLDQNHLELFPDPDH